MNFTKDRKANVFCGSPEYMAPEMILKEDYTRMIDFYAIGILLYEMIAGIPPFFAKKRSDLFFNIVNNEPKFYKGFSSKSKDLIRRLLRKDYTKRLGFLNGIRDIKKHSFFDGFDWIKLCNKIYTPPYQPSAREIYFSPEFTSIPVELNFEEEVVFKRKRLSEVEQITPNRSALKQEASTFGDFAGNAMANYSEQDDLSEPAFRKRKTSEPPTTRNFASLNKMVMEKRFNDQSNPKDSLYSEYSFGGEPTPVNNRETSLFGDTNLYDKSKANVKTIGKNNTIANKDPDEPAPNMRTFKKKKKKTGQEGKSKPKDAVPQSKFGVTMKSKRKTSPIYNFDDQEGDDKEEEKNGDRMSLKRSGSASHLELDHLISNNIISERQRIDPRELDSSNSQSSGEPSEEYTDSEDSINNEETKEVQEFPRMDTVKEVDNEYTLEDLAPKVSTEVLIQSSESDNFSIEDDEGVAQQVLSCTMKKSVNSCALPAFEQKNALYAREVTFRGASDINFKQQEGKLEYPKIKTGSELDFNPFSGGSMSGFDSHNIEEEKAKSNLLEKKESVGIPQ